MTYHSLSLRARYSRCFRLQVAHTQIRHPDIVIMNNVRLKFLQVGRAALMSIVCTANKLIQVSDLGLGLEHKTILPNGGCRVLGFTILMPKITENAPIA